MCDPEAIEQLADAGARTVGDVLPHGHVREERVVLEDEADATVLGREVDPGGRVEEHLAVERDAPALGARKARDRAQNRRLPGSRGPDQREGLATQREG
jgi:hypothetical protein